MPINNIWGQPNDGKTAASDTTEVSIMSVLKGILDSVLGNGSLKPCAAVPTSYSQGGAIAINTVLFTLDCAQARSVSLQCVSMGTSGVVTMEWSNDNVTWIAATLFTPAYATAATITAAGIFVTPVLARYLRARMSTAATAGTTAFNAQQMDDTLAPWLASQPVTMAAAGTNLFGDVGLQYRANATGAATASAVQSPAATTAANLKNGAGRLLGVQLQNSAAAMRSVKIFNAVTPTMGTTAAAYEIDIPAGGRVDFNFPGGIAFGTALTWAVTSAKGLTDNTSTGLAANDVSGCIAWA
jgi:hypothetical protein